MNEPTLRAVSNIEPEIKFYNVICKFQPFEWLNSSAAIICTSASGFSSTEEILLDLNNTLLKAFSCLNPSQPNNYKTFSLWIKNMFKGKLVFDRITTRSDVDLLNRVLSKNGWRIPGFIKTGMVVELLSCPEKLLSCETNIKIYTEMLAEQKVSDYINLHLVTVSSLFRT